MNNFTKSDVEYLLTPMAIRESTSKILKHALDGDTNFIVHLDKLEACSDYVMDVIKDNYPSLDIPFHSRWGHFRVGGINREKLLDKELVEKDTLEIVRTKLDLVITSVLLDAGAGKTWSYIEHTVKSGDSEASTYSRSEGLAVASFHLFMNGYFSTDNKIQADADGLISFSEKDLKDGFQVTAENPLVGVEGRVKLINSLGHAVGSNSTIFPAGRPGSIVDYLVTNHGNKFEVKDILDAVLLGLGPIWPGRIEADGINLGDVWHYKKLGTEVTPDSVICFHKLSQWLTYSLVVPMIDAGLIISGANKLTGLAEYRNGGLFLDFGVIELRNKELQEVSHKPSSDLIIEWRALTLQLLDRIAALVQGKLGKTADEFPLAKVLEGGTWWAGRKIAKEMRDDGSTPITLDSDGTVF